ncbi:hypothetical protein EHP00_2228 [Ecytonucleospora hepatopenaei]|uniref:Uncharacterized protein n=1 Tax=Ecytonucleospora hepatopenaei TaxID=646526 RepID=A0A1W0E4H0_9MICR|nr:hypothetical protein EHP00_2228 [Ecytonucleospora hepatopenaei]
MNSSINNIQNFLFIPPSNFPVQKNNVPDVAIDEIPLLNIVQMVIAQDLGIVSPILTTEIDANSGSQMVAEQQPRTPREGEDTRRFPMQLGNQFVVMQTKVCQ